MDQKNCGDLIQRWKELKSKLPVAQDLIPGQPIRLSYISPEELIELEKVGRELIENCWNSLSPAEKFELDREKLLSNKTSYAQ